MDPNFVQATLSGYFARSRRRDQFPMHLEREMVVYTPAGNRSHRSWVTAIRRWTGAGLILLGERIGQKSGPDPADIIAAS